MDALVGVGLGVFVVVGSGVALGDMEEDVVSKVALGRMAVGVRGKVALGSLGVGLDCMATVDCVAVGKGVAAGSGRKMPSTVKLQQQPRITATNSKPI